MVVDWFGSRTKGGGNREVGTSMGEMVVTRREEARPHYSTGQKQGDQGRILRAGSRAEFDDWL